MSTTFENARIGDRVWCMADGWGVIDDIEEGSDFPLRVSFPNGFDEMYTLDGIYGMYSNDYKVQTLFWDEVVIKAPSEPVRDLPVDTEVLVWMYPAEKHMRHFSHFNSQGKIHCFVNGRTSWTTKQTSDWLYWELRE